LKKIKASAPGKLIIFGEHSVVYGKPCIVTAVDQRVHVEASFNGADELVVDAPQMGILGYKRRVSELGSSEMPKQVSFIEAVVKRFCKKYDLNKGLSIKTESDFSHTFGFGSSSAVTVATAKALTELYRIRFSDKDLFDLCYRSVLDIQGVGSGFDLGAALWGGTIYYVKGAKEVSQLEVSSLPIVVAYSGVKADTPTLVRQVAELKRKKPFKVRKIFNEISRIVEKGKEEMEKRRWKEAGELFIKNQKLLEDLGVSTFKLEKMVKAAIEAGAYGAKLSGAGGGDCMIALCKKGVRSKVEKAIERVGGKIMKVGLNAKGVICKRL
jgi:mevalonate kinase